ncbi:zinc carboxypeptidase [Neolewinella xylanilytica]|uniref:Zinc carboxypeptidase n=1 Tax=Neolewinella xylanilytica TaxID=1514080 RepID=A0A2S6I631_9BACT|nr:M14 family metallopeptidase [Neolewinella xylanilytica]PPK86628.1 zinc carboxypeptidase [Neolewinella xylanilytica]
MKLYSSVIFFFYLAFLHAQTDIYERLDFPENLDQSEILSPRQFLGYRLGERFTEYAASVAYFDYLDEQSPRLRVERYGSTYEGRPLLLVIATNAENMERLEAIRATQLQLVDSWEGDGAQVESLLASQPVINSYSYNIHGNEASSTEAAMQVAYELATTEDPVTETALASTVNLLFVCINPDGRDRYVYWYNGMARATGGEEPHDLEHYAPFPNGRTNHYWFDLNRDWVWGVHPESRGHTRAYQRWMPSVHTDYHEQGYDANYFTVPGTMPRNLLLPDAYEYWADTFGRANIAAFDPKGISYFTRDRFDFFYPSYGSSYPSVMGAIGMLVEQGGIAAGRAVETEDSYVLTLRQRIWDHYSTSIAQLRTAAKHREALQRYSLAAWNPLNSKQQTTAYLIENDGNPYFDDFLQMLLMNGVRVERTTEPLDAPGLSYRTGQVVADRIHPAGSLIVGTEQARHLFLNSILANDLAIEDSVMYDMSTWSAPLAYNLEAYTFDAPVQVNTEPVTVIERRGTVSGPTDSPVYAYVIDWSQRNAPQALAALWKNGLRVRASLEPFSTDAGATYSAGSLIVLRGRNLEKEGELPALMRQLAADFGLRIERFTTGRMRDGNDLASTRNFPLREPRVAMLVDEPFDTYTSGQIYFLFDWETQLPVTRIRTSVLRQTAVPKFGQRYGYADLFDYDVVVLPDANNLEEVFDKEQRRVLMDWITAGGTLVTVGETAEFFTTSNDFTDQQLNVADRDTSERASLLPFAERTDYYGKKNIPGSALRASLDTTHPLAFGMQPEVYTLKFGSSSLEPEPGLQTVGRYTADSTRLLAAGYAPREAINRLAGNAWAGVRQIGQGQLVYLLDNPHYRMFWRGPSRLMQNAVMMVPGM